MIQRHSISVDGETAELVDKVIALVNDSLGIKLTRHTAIKYMANDMLKKTNNIPEEV